MRAENQSRLASMRDLILDRAEIQAGDRVLDVGTGQGLLGLGALERVGPQGHVVFSDISEALLDDCREAVAQVAAGGHSTFLAAAATDLSAIGTASIDVVVERAVLLFIEDRARALSEYHRVLRSGGRVSLGEPLNSWMSADRPGYLWGYDVTAAADLERKLHLAELRTTPCSAVSTTAISSRSPEPPGSSASRRRPSSRSRPLRLAMTSRSFSTRPPIRSPRRLARSWRRR